MELSENVKLSLKGAVRISSEAVGDEGHLVEADISGIWGALTDDVL